ncbi:MAG: BON domain-containing protein [Myxococcales bacterium]|jgi:osmotically-inducible protein OsmY
MHYPHNLSEEGQRRLDAIHRQVDAEPRLVHRTDAVRMELNDGRIRVRGEVEDVSIKRLLERSLGRAAGADGLDARIRVTPPQTMDDKEIRRRLLDELVSEAAFSACGIAQHEAGRWQWLREPPQEPRAELRVAVEDGVVCLEGRVGDPSQRRLAEVMAWWVSGTRDVDNRIESRSQPVGDDGELLDVIRLAFEKNPWLDSADIRPRAEAGVVTLEGTVHSESDRDVAERDVWCTPGIRDVENALRVAPAGRGRSA